MKNRATTLILCALVMLVDGYDLFAMPLALPHLVKQFGIAAPDFSVAISAVLVGLGGGALFLAPLGDRFGRRPLVIASAAVMSLATFGTATGTGVWSFACWRLLTGLGLGACLPNVTSLVSEMAPPGWRAGTVTLVSCAISIGSVVAGTITPLLVARGGWPALFLAPGAFTLVLTLLLFLLLAESTKLQESRAGPKASLLGPFEPQYAFATLVFVGLYTVNAFALYMLNSWLPTLLPKAGFSVAAGSWMSAGMQAGGLVGGLTLSLFLDRSKTVAALGTAYLLVAAALALFSLVPAQAATWSILLMIVGGGISGPLLASMAVGTGFYPPRMTSAAIGVAVAVGRLGAIAGPFVGGQLIRSGFGPAPFFLALIVPVLVCAGWVLMIPKVRKPV